MARTIGTYKSYNFVDKDPIIDKVRTLITQLNVTLAYVGNKSGVTTQTMRNWFDGQTCRPQFATVNAVARALGHELVLVERKMRVRG
jgi:DNA-binding phage protein